MMPKERIKNRILSHIENRRNTKKPLSSAVIFIMVALAAGAGYFAGTFNYQIQAAIGPVFGYKAHSGSIDLSSVQETYNNLAANFDGDLDVKELIYGANRGLVEAAGDIYTEYMSPSEAVEFNNSLNGNIGGGIGAVIGIKNEQIIINKPLKDNPAIKAGLKAGDIIVKINDESTAGWTVDKAVGKIRGEEGTTVKLTILRGAETKDYTVTRAIINNPSVDSEISGDIGIMTITRFDGETGRLAYAAAQEFVSKGVKGVILDLRGNSGGYVSSAVDVASLWLDNKVVVVEKSGNIIKDTLKSGSNPLLAGLKTVVLVDGGSASASEIVAGALKDHGVAELVGDKTFGKGSVQLPISLGGGAQMKVTIAKWYTPNGKNINEEGIDPDTAVTLSQSDVDKGIDPQMDAAKKQLGL